MVRVADMWYSHKDVHTTVKGAKTQTRTVPMKDGRYPLG